MKDNCRNSVIFEAVIFPLQSAESQQQHKRQLFKALVFQLEDRLNQLWRQDPFAKL